MTLELISRRLFQAVIIFLAVALIIPSAWHMVLHVVAVLGVIVCAAFLVIGIELFNRKDRP